MKNLDKANEWLQRAKSNMARAKAGRVSPDRLSEDLCYGGFKMVYERQNPVTPNRWRAGFCVF